jgi:hypothetical protein
VEAETEMVLYCSFERRVVAYEASQVRLVLVGEGRLAAWEQKGVVAGAWQPTYLAPETRALAGLVPWLRLDQYP